MAEELYRRYAKEIRGELGYGVSWAPTTVRQLGEIGTLEDGVFATAGHLAEIGFDVSPSTVEAPNSDWLYQSRGSVEITLKAAGATDAAFQHVATASAGARVSFGREYAMVLAMHDAKIVTLASRMAFEKELLRRYAEKDLSPHQVVVVEVVKTESTTLLISNANDATAELEAKADLGGAAKIGDVSAGLGIAYSRAIGMQMVAERGVTPLFRTIGLKRRFWSGDSRLEAQLAPDADPSEYFVEVFPEDWADDTEP